MKNSTLLFKRELDSNTSVIVTFNYYSQEYQVRLNQSGVVKYQSTNTLKNAQSICLDYLSIAKSIIKE